MREDFKYFAIFLAVIIFCAAMVSRKIESNHYDFAVTITYLNGDSECIVLSQSREPRVYDNGCLYDYSKETYICGIRKISFLKTSQTK